MRLPNDQSLGHRKTKWIESYFVSFRCTEQATNKVVVTTIEELDLDSNAMSAAAAQGIMLLESDNGAAGGDEMDNGKQRKSGGGGDGKSKFTAALSTGVARSLGQCRLSSWCDTLSSASRSNIPAALQVPEIAYAGRCPLGTPIRGTWRGLVDMIVRVSLNRSL